MKTEFTFHADAGHGWLAVPVELIQRLNVTVSSYSYWLPGPRGGTAYLEEDSDAPRLLDAFARSKGVTDGTLMDRVHQVAVIWEVNDGDRSPIRKYGHYTQ